MVLTFRNPQGRPKYPKMKKLKKALILTTSMIIGLTVEAQNMQGREEHISQISLKIAMKASEIGPQDDIVAIVSMENISATEHCQPIERGYGNALLSGFIPAVVDSSGTAVSLSPGARESLPEARNYKTLCLQPGKTFVQELHLRKVLDIRAPGRYALTVHFRDQISGDRVYSNKVSFEMRE